jgi:hypothetical protein
MLGKYQNSFPSLLLSAIERFQALPYPRSEIWALVSLKYGADPNGPRKWRSFS